MGSVSCLTMVSIFDVEPLPVLCVPGLSGSGFLFSMKFSGGCRFHGKIVRCLTGINHYDWVIVITDWVSDWFWSLFLKGSYRRKSYGLSSYTGTTGCCVYSRVKSIRSPRLWRNSICISAYLYTLLGVGLTWGGVCQWVTVHIDIYIGFSYFFPKP